MRKTRKCSGLLTAAISRGRPAHVELPFGGQGLTQFDRITKQVALLQTPADPLVRYHESLHARHTQPDSMRGLHPFASQLVEDCRLHSQCWDWPHGQTPRVLADSAIAFIDKERADMAKGVKNAGADMTLDKRGELVCHAMRERETRLAITGYGDYPEWMTDAEMRVAYEAQRKINCGNARGAARLLQRAFWPDWSPDLGEPVESGNGEPIDDGEPCDDDGEPRDGEPTYGEPEATLRDQGPFTEPCGDDLPQWLVAKTGPRIYRPALRKPVLPARCFVRRIPSVPGGTTLIDASGSMKLTPDDIVAIIDASPHATLAMYSGNDEDSCPRGEIVVIAKDGWRLSDDAIRNYVESRDGGNSIDLEALDWLLEQGEPRVMVTDRRFCGSPYSGVALLRLEQAEESGDVTVIENGHDLIPGYVAPKDDESC
jgi:hypothetical protein